MPQAGAAVVAFFQSTAWYVVVIRTILVNVALGALSRKLSKRNETGPPPLNVTVRGSVEPRRLVFGTRRVGGVLVFYGSSSINPSASTKEYLWYVIAVAGHQVSAISDIWLDTEKISNSDINAGTGAVTGGKFNGKVYVWKHLGGGAQLVDSNLDSAFSDWTSDHRLRGTAYIVVRLQRDDAIFAGAPQSITSIVNGALIYDQRLDSTNGGSGSHRADNPNTWGPSRNPALITQWVLSGGSVVNDQATRKIMYGLREPYDRIVSAYIVAAANECDESISGANAPPSGAQPRYQCDLEVTCGETRRDILNAILATMAGTATMVHGKWRVYAGAYDTPVHALNQDDLYGEMEVQDTSPHTERYNAVSATFVDASKQYVEDTTPFRTDSAYETQDGGERITREIDLRGVTDQYQVQRLCEIELRRSRMQRTVRPIGSLNLLKVAQNETITYSHARYGWTNRIFRAIERQFDFNADAGRLMLTCQREDPAVYADLLTADYTTGTSATDTFSADTPSAPTSLVATSRLNGIEFTWSQPAEQLAESETELWEYTSSSPFASATRISNGIYSPFFLPRADTTTRYYWVRQRAFRLAGVSATEPATNGVAGAAARIDIENTTASAQLGPVTGTDPSVSVHFSRTGRSVSVVIDPVTGTSEGVLLEVYGGTPAGYVPTRHQNFPCFVINSGVRVAGYARIGPGSGDIELYVAAGDNFTVGVTVGVPTEGISFTYTLD